MSHPVLSPDGFALKIGPYQGTILFVRTPPLGKDPKGQVLLGEVCLSPLLMKCLAIKLKKFLREHEDAQGSIYISPELANKEGFSPSEDWA